MTFRSLVSFAVMMTMKTLARVFYRLTPKYLNQTVSNEDWKNVKLLIFLHHTSLFEPIYLGVVPNAFVWKLSKRMVAPMATKTGDRPIVGKIFKFMGPAIVSITRKRDASWSHFLNEIHPDSVITIVPEGRMMRAPGMDAYGHRMSVKGGVAEILHKLDSGKILFAYSGGLHHIQYPGQWPHIFKEAKINIEFKNLMEYKREIGFEHASFKEFKDAVIADLERRKEENCPFIGPHSPQEQKSSAS